MIARWLLALLLLATLSSPARAMPPGVEGSMVHAAAAALEALELEEAATRLRAIAPRYRGDPDVLRLRALLHLHRGQYAEAAESMERSIDAAAPRNRGDDRESLLSLMRETRDATRGWARASSPSGRFMILHQPGPDALLVPYALEALSEIDTYLSAELGHRVPGPIRLELHPDAASLARVSSLSEEAIARTGTIALCKWDRLMVTSPRSLVQGYPWVDTISHEYVHLVLARATRDRAPVWLQEGIAKLLERGWRGERPSANLEPAVEAILGAAIRDDRMIPFERLHPSIALLPSQSDAALAFAQVATFMEGFRGAQGSAGLRRALTLVSEGRDAREALAEVAGERFESLEASWRHALERRPTPAGPPPRLLERRLGAQSGDELSRVQAGDPRRHLRLGDLLWDRGRARAAAAEYARALQADPHDPILHARLARAALAGGEFARAAEALESMLARHPHHAPTRALMASARLGLGQLEAAHAQALEALRLNPFDPMPHCVLSQAAPAEPERERERHTCLNLGGMIPGLRP
ncbi:MAG: tetratricopeptide repeat protein [Myxococcales bacterium]|nr:tetratricopeptide repeat protein [Myxococcales bacterium]